MAERAGDWQLTASGKEFWPLDPRPADIDIRDIAHHLGSICRWGGAPARHYSVGEHSVMLARHFVGNGRTDFARWALMHDAAEAYLGDIVRPLKPAFTNFRGHERHLETMIWKKYGLIGEMPSPVLRADTAILGDERDQLFDDQGAHRARRRSGETGLGLTLECWAADHARIEFLNAFGELFPGVWQ